MSLKRRGSGFRRFGLDGRLGVGPSALQERKRASREMRQPDREQPAYLSALDLGTTHLKAVVCQMETDRVVVLGQSVEPWEGRLQAAGNGVDPALVGACEHALRQAEDSTEGVAGRKIVADRVVLGLPAAAIQVAARSVSYERRLADEPIDEAELERALLGAQRAALRSVCLASGAPPDLLLLAPCSRVHIDIDGHLVDDPIGLRGSVIRIHSFNARAPRALIQTLEGLADQMKFDPPYMAIESQATLVAHAHALGVEGLGLDVGGRSTTLLFWRDGMLQESATFPAGGRDVTAILGRACQLDEKGAERLKADYVAGHFDEGQRQWIQEILRPPLQRWAEQVARRLAAWSEVAPLPPNVWLWGGGALLRETEEAARWAAQGLAFAGFPHVQRLADVAHPGFINRAGGPASALCAVAHSLALGQAARLRATPEQHALARATLAACKSEHIAWWEPVDG